MWFSYIYCTSREEIRVSTHDPDLLEHMEYRRSITIGVREKVRGEVQTMAVGKEMSLL